MESDRMFGFLRQFFTEEKTKRGRPIEYWDEKHIKRREYYARKKGR